MGRVLAVPDPRTSSIIITASKTLMPQIADMIAELDSDKGRKEVVGYFDLQNADPRMSITTSRICSTAAPSASKTTTRIR